MRTGLEFDDELQQFYARAWKLMPAKEQAEMPMQGLAEGEDENTRPKFAAGSLGAELDAMLSGDGKKKGKVSIVSAFSIGALQRHEFFHDVRLLVPLLVPLDRIFVPGPPTYPR